MTETFGDRLAVAVERAGAPVAVGIDPHLGRLPAALRASWAGLEGAAFREAAGRAVAAFGAMVVEAVASRVAAIKPQVAFYEQLGWPGWAALEDTCRRAREAGLLVIADAKRGDIASTAEAYGRAFLDPRGPLAADALTVNPWMGADTLDPYLRWCREAGRGLFVLVRTTNPGSARLQGHGEPTAARQVARMVHEVGLPFTGRSGLSAVGAVVGATASEEAAELRRLMPGAWFLVPGIGAQGGGPEAARAGLRPEGGGVLVVAARSVLFPDSDGGAYDLDPVKFMQGRAEDLLRGTRVALSSVT